MPHLASPSPTNSTRSVPIFILGISERSGTNFLFHLLCLHPECHPGGPIWENYLTLHLDLLVRFAETVYAQWNPQWNVAETIGPSGVLLEDLGNGLIDYLNRQMRGPPSSVGSTTDREANVAGGAAPGRRRLVTKNPSVRNLPLFFRLFPRAPLLILVRDGRAVVESGVRSFGLSYEHATHDWTDAGTSILQFLESPIAKQSPLRLVKDEDLFHHPEKQLRNILEFLRLSPERYDFSAAQRLPVVGSSELAQQGERTVHWRGVEKQAGFDPTRRWEHWSAARKERFLWIGGEVLKQLGYPTQPPATSHWWWTARNMALDLMWRLRWTRRFSQYFDSL
jgi:hypothetical protein